MIEVVNLAAKFALFSDHWRPRIVGELNGQQVVPTAGGLWPGSWESSSGTSTTMPTSCSWSSRACFG